MSRKTEVTIAVLIILILIAVLLFLFYKPAADTTKKTTDSGNLTTSDTTSSTDTATEQPVAPPQHATATTVGRIFVERFGSYSTDADYANVDDVLPLATDSLKARLQQLAEDARKTAGDSYYGVSTNVIKITVDEQTDTTQMLTVKTQREESFDSPANTSVRYQDISLEFVKVGDDWLVDDFTWL